jgi:DNA-binding NtrC family response regulator
MYGLTHRLPPPDVENDAAEVAPAFRPRGTVLLVHRDPMTLRLVRPAVEADHRLIVARDADQARAALRFACVDVLVLDRALPRREAAAVIAALSDPGDPVPTIVLDHDLPVSATAVRSQVCRAIRVARRGYLGGGLRSRMAA